MSATVRTPATLRTSVAVLLVAVLVAGCGSLAEPPPDATGDDPRALRATDPETEPPAADVQDDRAEASSPEGDGGSDPAGTEDADEDAAEGDAEAAAADESRVDERHIHPEQYMTRWLDHYLPGASEEEWAVGEPGTYTWDLAGLAEQVEPDAAFRAELDAYVREVRSLPADERPIDTGYVALEFDGGFTGVMVHLTSSRDGEAVRVMELAGSVLSFIAGLHNAHIADTQNLDGVHLFHVTEGAGGIEGWIWRQGPRTVIMSGPYGVGMDEIARATIVRNS